MSESLISDVPLTIEFPMQSPNSSLGQTLLRSTRQWLDSIEIQDRQLAHLLCKLIPAQCPFAREIKVFGRPIGHIPPMCKLNPLYDQLVGLRFRCLCYLVEECGETL